MIVATVLIGIIWSDAYTLDTNVSHTTYTEVTIPQTIDSGSDNLYPALRILDQQDREVPYVLDSFRLPLTVAAEGTAKPSMSESNVQTYQTDLKAQHATISTIVFSTPQSTFERLATVEYSSDDATWYEAEEITLSRFHDQHPRLAFNLPGQQQGRYWRIRIKNGNDAPIADLHVKLLAPTHAALFEAKPGQRYRLIVETSNATAPIYDLGARLKHEAPRISGQARIISHERREIKPWSERHPWALFAACAFTGIALLLSSCLTLRSPPRNRKT